MNIFRLCLRQRQREQTASRESMMSIRPKEDAVATLPLHGGTPAAHKTDSSLLSGFRKIHRLANVDSVVAQALL
jgi:hypothetical protein